MTGGNGLLEHVNLFSHEGLEYFAVQVDSDITYSTEGKNNIRLALDDVESACKGIKKLIIHVYLYHREIRDGFNNLMENAKSLETLWIHSGMLASGAMVGLSKFLKLKRNYIGAGTGPEINSDEEAFVAQP